MHLRFDFDKSLQAAAFLLELEGGSMEYLRLIKLLYIAERELLSEAATPLTGDTFKAMQYGPVLGNVLDLIKDRHWKSSEWDIWIRRTFHSVRLQARPGRSALSRCIIDKLEEVFDRYRDTNTWELAEKTHEFLEWRKNYPGSGSAVIPLADVLDATGAEAGTLEAILEDQAIRDQMGDIIDASRVDTGPDLGSHL